MKQLMRILFIGNSHTYVNDLPLLVKQILQANGVVCEVTMLSHPGMGLDYHLGQPEVRFNILFGNYDYIVLQHDAHPFRGEEILVSCVKGICEIISKTDAKTILYMTWTQKNNPVGQAVMSEAYRTAARETGSMLAPVGLAWQLFQAEQSGCELYGADGEHASEQGSLLAAYTIAAKILNCDIHHANDCEKVFCSAAVKAILS